jgi:hypothetical protein
MRANASIFGARLAVSQTSAVSESGRSEIGTLVTAGWTWYSRNDGTVGWTWLPVAMLSSMSSRERGCVGDVVVGEGLRHRGAKLLTDGGKAIGTARAVKQTAADASLECANRLADPRRRDAQPLRGAAEVQFFGEYQERADLPQLYAALDHEEILHNALNDRPLFPQGPTAQSFEHDDPIRARRWR